MTSHTLAAVGISSPCRAKDPATCRYHGSLQRMAEALNTNDYASYHSAREALGKTLKESENDFRPSLLGDIESANISRAYAHYSIINNHIHNGTDVGGPAEITYYSSAQGQLELKRRLNTSYKEEYLRIQEEINEHNGVLPYSFENNENDIDTQVEKGKNDIVVLTEFSLSAQKDKTLETSAIRHYLVEESNKWMKNLTTEQQEAVSWITSNGFKMAQYAADISDSAINVGIFNGLVDEDSIRDKHPFDYKAGDEAVAQAHKKYAKKFLKTVNQAFSRAPKLNQPILLSRGTSFAEVEDIIASNLTSSRAEIMDQIERGDYSGKPISEKARMRKLPMSASVSPLRALSFSNRMWDEDNSSEDREVLIQVKAKSSTSPVNVGAWGSKEFEMLTNPKSDYKIVGGRRVENNLFVLELEEQ